MELISVTILRPIGTRNGLYWGDCYDESPRKSMRDLPGKTGEPGTRSQVTEVRTSIQVSHLYLRALSEGACQTASECGRQAEWKMLSVCSPASSPPSKGCGPCAALRLSHEQERTKREWTKKERRKRNDEGGNLR